MQVRKLAVVFLLSSIPLAAKEPRTVTVCAVTDAPGITLGKDPIIPVERKEIDKIVQRASREYRRNVDIAFKIVEYHETSIPVERAGAYSREFRATCEDGDIVAVFTNQAGVQVLPNGESTHLAGHYELDYGVIWSYEVSYQEVTFKKKFRAHMHAFVKYHHLAIGEMGGDNPVTDFKHEVAHLFGVEHSEKNVDFMYWEVGSDDWSDRIRSIIKTNRDRTWKPEKVTSKKRKAARCSSGFIFG